MLQHSGMVVAAWAMRAIQSRRSHLPSWLNRSTVAWRWVAGTLLSILS